MELLSAVPVSERNVTAAARVYRECAGEGVLRCVWSGRAVLPERLAVDHMLPFAVWRCNDLWNLVPADESVNARKSDRIPAGELLVLRKDAILACWHLMYARFPERFAKEVSVGLLGEEFGEGWEERAFERLCGISAYLIETRGYEGVGYPLR